MDSYELDAPCNVQDVVLGERFDLSFEAGTVTPKNEVEEYALERLVEAGAARKVPKHKKAEK